MQWASLKTNRTFDAIEPKLGLDFKYIKSVKLVTTDFVYEESLFQTSEGFVVSLGHCIRSGIARMVLGGVLIRTSTLLATFTGACSLLGPRVLLC